MKKNIFLLILSYSAMSFADDIHFDTSMIDTSSDSVADLSLFDKKGTQLPGNYLVDVYLNGKYLSEKEIIFLTREKTSSQRDHRSLAVAISPEHQFVRHHDRTGLVACIDKNVLEEAGVIMSQLPATSPVAAGKCLVPEYSIPNAFTNFDFAKMRLNISIPQAAMKQQPHGWVSPQRWNQGINAAFLNYIFSGSENYGRYGDSRSHYLYLTTGINFGGWRLRDNSTLSNSVNRYGHQRRWDHLSTYAQKAIIPLRSELTVGDKATENTIFDSFSFRGISMATDDSMYPDTMRGYAPEIKGAAYSNARVSIRQNGGEIYRTFVSPGPFVIKDLYPVSAGGDLEVRVTEIDGTVHIYTIPYSSVPLLQRHGHLRYTATVGRFHNINSRYDSPGFFQSTAQFGLPFDITSFGGAELSEHYRAAVLGVGANMGLIGAVSADVTHARSTLSDGRHYQGQSVRLLYARSLVAIGTTLQVAGYRYSTTGFHTLDETALKRMSGWLYDTDTVDPTGQAVKQNWVNYYNLYNSRKDRLQVNLTQRLGGHGSIFFTGSSQRYWQNSDKTRMWQVGYNSNWDNVSYSVSYSNSHVSSQPGADKALFLSLSLPLNAFMHSSTLQAPIWATTSTTTSNGSNSLQAGLAGTALENGNLDWDVSQGYGNNEGKSGSANLAYRGTYGSSAAGYSYGRDYHQFRYGASGSVLLHGNGLTLGQHLGETNVLIEAPGAAGVPLENGSGVSTDWRGYAIVPYASVYRENRIALDVNQLDEHTDIDNAVRQVVPSRGAIVPAAFVAHVGARVIMKLTHDGKPLPFGTTVSADGRSSIVGDEGEIYFSGLKQHGKLNAKWGNGREKQCSVRYLLSERDMGASVVRVNQSCN